MQSAIPSQSNGWIVDVTARNFDQMVAKAEVPVLVDFWAPWCGPCQQLSPALEAIAVHFDGRLHIAKVNVDNETTLAAGFSVRSIPTLVLFHEGKAVEQMVGLRQPAEIASLCEKYTAPAQKPLRLRVQNALLVKDYATALPLLEQALEEEPGNSGLLADIARTQLALGHHSAAQSTLAKLPDEIRANTQISALAAQIDAALATN